LSFRKNFFQSLTGRLFRLVFGGYVLLAIVVTVGQLTLEFSTVQNTIAEDLTSLGESFNGGVTVAMWEMDREQLGTIARGIAQSSIVTGVKITSNNGEVFATVGDVPTTKINGGSNFLAHTQFYTSPLQRQGLQSVRELGELTVYSNRSIAIERVKYSFIVILINSIIKTSGLWLIFYFVITRSLSDPLSYLTGIVSRLEFAADSKEPTPLDYPHQDELGRLLGAMGKMQERLFTARGELENVNQALEKTVAERTQNLADAVAFNETILLSSPVPVGVYTGEGECVLANEAYAELVGTTRDRLLAQNFHNIGSWQDSGLLKDCLIALASHVPQSREVHVDTSFGKSVWMDYKITPTLLNGIDHLLIQFYDLSTRKSIEDKLRHAATQLQESQLELEKANLAKDQFVSILAHDLRGPIGALNALLSSTQMDDGISLDPEMLEICAQSAARVYQLLENLLAWSQSQQGLLQPLPEKIDLQSLLVEAQELAHEGARQKGIELVINSTPSLSLEGDVKMIQTILRNLLSNAIKFTPRGKKIFISGYVQDATAVIEVQDQGVGMSSEVLSRLFKLGVNKFSTDGTEEETGSGFGLLLVDEFVKKNGGSLKVESILDQGSTFQVHLPLPN